MTPTPQPKALEPEFLDDGTLTVVYRGIASGDEAGAVIKHPKMVASSWSHAMNDRDRFLSEAQRAIFERDSLRAEVERLRADAERLDWLDEQNARKNSANGTTYGWSLNENCNRIALEDHGWPPVNVRAAIDAAREAKG